MTFAPIGIGIGAFYFLGYFGMMIYDAFFKKDPTDLVPKHEDEDVDISDEAGSFKPIKVEREPVRQGRKTEEETGVVTEQAKVINETGTETGYNNGTEGRNHNDNDNDRKAHVDSFGEAEPPNRKSLSDKEHTSNETVTDKYEDIASEGKLSEESDTSEGKTEQPEDKAETPTEATENGSPQKGQAGTEPILVKEPDNDSEPQRSDYSEGVDDSLPMVRMYDDETESRMRMIGAMKVEKLIEDAEELAEKGKDSPLGKMLADWKVYETEQDAEGAENLRLLMASDNSDEGSAPPVLEI